MGRPDKVVVAKPTATAPVTDVKGAKSVKEPKVVKGGKKLKR